MGLGCPLLLGSSARRLRRCAATIPYTDTYILRRNTRLLEEKVLEQYRENNRTQSVSRLLAGLDFLQ